MRPNGFTQIELIVVIVVAGILAATIVPRWGGETGFEERGLRDQTLTALRYAQKTAIAARRTVCATFTATTVSFFVSSAFGAADCSAGAALLAPDGGGALLVTATRNAQFSPVPEAITFDAQGRSAAAASIAISNLPAALSITVEAETGYVH